MLVIALQITHNMTTQYGHCFLFMSELILHTGIRIPTASLEGTLIIIAVLCMYRYHTVV